MKVGIYTVDLFPGREKLMPWRTMVETGKYLSAKGIEAEIISVSKERENSDYEFSGLHITSIRNDLNEIARYINHNGFDVFLFQVKWRDGLKNLNALSQVRCRKIAYFDGGVFHLRNTMPLILTTGFKIARPFLLESITPKSLILHKLKKTGFRKIITLSSLTEKYVEKYAYVKSSTIFPGNDFRVENPSQSNKKEEEKFFLFTGAPHRIRGSIQLLKAFDLFADVHNDAKIIFLMRNDVDADYSFFDKEYNKLRNKSKVEVIRENLSPAILENFFKRARAVVLPFLTIPSEIPLTFFEVLSKGTPIITFENSGTTSYLSPALAISTRRNFKSLSKLMSRIWTDDAFHSSLSMNALSIMREHPTWKESGEKWFETISEK